MWEGSCIRVGLFSYSSGAHRDRHRLQDPLPETALLSVLSILPLRGSLCGGRDRHVCESGGGGRCREERGCA